MPDVSRTRHALKIQSLEALETRRNPARYAVPWLDPEHLTISFAPDGTQVGTQTSSIFQKLDQYASRSSWQREILRAFQTWAVHANINFGLQSDNGEKFGSTGKAQGEEDYGDIRVGAIPLAPNAVMTSAPYDPIFAGTLSGDVTINSLYQFNGGSSGNYQLGFTDLFSGMLHEAGHVLGLDHSQDPNSIMNEQLSGINRLSNVDIANLQDLYGARLNDEYEGVAGNNTIANATRISAPTITTPQVIYGDITTNSDVDVYSIRPPAGYFGAMIFKVRTDGRSLLQPDLKILDSDGRVVGQASSNKLGGDTVTVRLSSVNPNKTYYISVKGAAQDEFGVGGYALGVVQDNLLAFLGMTATGLLTNSNNDSLLYDVLGLLSPLSANDNTPIELTNSSFSRQSANNNRVVLDGEAADVGVRYQALGNLALSTDLDVFEVTAPTGVKAADSLLVRVAGFGPSSAPPRAVVLNQQGQPVAAEVLTSSVGGYMVQVRNPVPGAKYLIRVEMPDAPLGNVHYYQMDALFSDKVADNYSFLSGTIGARGAQTRNLYVAQSQVFHILLQTGGLAGLEMTIRDAVGRIVFRIKNNGDPLSAETPYLDPGAYSVEFKSTNPYNSIAYAVTGMTLTDPIGPGLSNPNRQPVYQDPYDSDAYQYPGGNASQESYYWA